MKVIIISLFLLTGCYNPHNCTVAADKESEAATFVVKCMEGSGFSNSNDHESYCRDMSRMIYCKPNVEKFYSKN